MLSRFFSYYRPHWKLFLLDFGCAVFAGLMELAFPLAVKTFCRAARAGGHQPTDYDTAFPGPDEK